MKYRPKYPFKGFASIEKARRWVKGFVVWYNQSHLHSGIKFLTPHQRHCGLGKNIMENRKIVYEKARAKHPERWSGNIKDWSLPKYVALNPLTEQELESVLENVL